MPVKSTAFAAYDEELAYQHLRLLKVLASINKNEQRGYALMYKEASGYARSSEKLIPWLAY